MAGGSEQNLYNHSERNLYNLPQVRIKRVPDVLTDIRAVSERHIAMTAVEFAQVGGIVVCFRHSGVL
jgi:hypothetical protein